MNKKIIFQLIKFVKSKNYFGDRLKYTFLSAIYFIPLLIENRKDTVENDDELLGDDVYPLF